jgi:hypothetical protein
MRVIPLYSWPADPLASHRVTAPGGFELWQFEAEDPLQALRVKVEFALGHPNDAEYQQAYRRFLRKPTCVDPPLPRQFASVWCSLTEAQREFCNVKARLASTDIIELDSGLDLRFRFARFARTEKGTVLLSVASADGSETELHFHPEVNSLRTVEGLIRTTRKIDFKGTGSIQHTFGTDIFQ